MRQVGDRALMARKPCPPVPPRAARALPRRACDGCTQGTFLDGLRVAGKAWSCPVEGATRREAGERACGGERR